MKGKGRSASCGWEEGSSGRELKWHKIVLKSNLKSRWVISACSFMLINEFNGLEKGKKETLDGDFVVCESGEDGAHMCKTQTSAVNRRTKQINQTWAFPPPGFFFFFFFHVYESSLNTTWLGNTRYFPLSGNFARPKNNWGPDIPVQSRHTVTTFYRNT